MPPPHEAPRQVRSQQQVLERRNLNWWTDEDGTPSTSELTPVYRSPTLGPESDHQPTAQHNSFQLRTDRSPPTAQHNYFQLQPPAHIAPDDPPVVDHRRPPMSRPRHGTQFQEASVQMPPLSSSFSPLHVFGSTQPSHQHGLWGSSQVQRAATETTDVSPRPVVNLPRPPPVADLASYPFEANFSPPRPEVRLPPPRPVVNFPPPPELNRYPPVPLFADDTSTFVWQNNLGSTSSPEGQDDDDVLGDIPELEPSDSSYYNTPTPTPEDPPVSPRPLANGFTLPPIAGESFSMPLQTSQDNSDANATPAGANDDFYFTDRELDDPDTRPLGRSFLRRTRNTSQPHLAYVTRLHEAIQDNAHPDASPAGEDGDLSELIEGDNFSLEASQDNSDSRTTPADEDNDMPHVYRDTPVDIFYARLLANRHPIDDRLDMTSPIDGADFESMGFSGDLDPTEDDGGMPELVEDGDFWSSDEDQAEAGPSTPDYARYAHLYEPTASHASREEEEDLTCIICTEPMTTDPTKARRAAMTEEDTTSSSQDDAGAISASEVNSGVQLPEQAVTLLKCKHSFGQTCITTWLSEPRRPRCPMCRAELSDVPMFPLSYERFRETARIRARFAQHREAQRAWRARMDRIQGIEDRVQAMEDRMQAREDRLQAIDTRLYTHSGSPPPNPELPLPPIPTRRADSSENSGSSLSYGWFATTGRPD